MTTRQYSEAESAHFQSPTNPTPAIDITHSVSVNTVPSLQNEFLLNDTLRGGYRFEGRMSSVRRSFCLFVTFDVFFVGLMWLICIMLQGESIWDAIDEQIKHYNIKKSLFDVFFLAICRFVLLCLFYGIIHINHWIVILITVISTCAFSLTKVIYYDWHQTPQPVFQVLTILVSFILAWGEAWFFDNRVLPQESYATQFIFGSTDERTPLIRHYLRGAASTRNTESVENFHSPLNSPEGSMYRFGLDNGPVLGRYPPADLSRDEVDRYESNARVIMEESRELFRSDGWTLEKDTEDGIAHSMHLPSGHKIFKISATFNASPRIMLEELYYGVETIPQWNSALLEAQRIQIIDEHTDILYQLAASGAGGLVSSRDFVSLRYWEQIGDTYLIATKGTEHPNVPKNNRYVRGENGVTCLLMEPAENENQCKMTFILNTNLKGWIPQAIVDLALVDTLYDYIKCLTIHIDRRNQLGNGEV